MAHAQPQSPGRQAEAAGDSQPGRTEYDVYVSYSAADSQQIEGVLKALTEAGFRVFEASQAGDESEGDEINDIPATALASSRAALVYVSANSADSESCAREWQQIAARAATTLCVLPVRLDATPLPDVLEDAVCLGAGDLSPDETAHLVRERLDHFDAAFLASAMSLSDEQLVSRIATERDHYAFQVFCARKQPDVLDAVRSIVSRDRTDAATDVAATVWNRVWQDAHTFATSDGNLRSWLDAIAQNSSLDYMQRCSTG
jgi:TIR domain/Sigma-70 region 2